MNRNRNYPIFESDGGFSSAAMSDFRSYRALSDVSSSGNLSAASSSSSGSSTSTYSFFPQKRKIRRIPIVAEDLPRISIVASAPVTDKQESFGWGSFPVSSRHVSPPPIHGVPVSLSVSKDD